MSAVYATAKAAYKELRLAVGPWAKANGYRRWTGTQAGWKKNVGDSQTLFFKFEGYTFVDPETGNSYHGTVQLEPKGANGMEILRQSDFTCCLIQSELDAFARIQGTINRRRPKLPWYLKNDIIADTILGHGLRKERDPSPEYREGHMIEFGYHTLEDARELATFLASVVPQALERFLEGRVAKPIDTTPEHLKPKWLKELTKRD